MQYFCILGFHVTLFWLQKWIQRRHFSHVVNFWFSIHTFGKVTVNKKIQYLQNYNGVLYWAAMLDGNFNGILWSCDLLVKTIHGKHSLLGPKAPSLKMQTALFFSSWCCRFCTLDADWFAAPLLSAHHKLGQWTGTSGDERFGTLIWLINAYA